MSEIFDKDGLLGVLEFLCGQFSKMFWTSYYRLRLKKVGAGTVFKGRLHVTGGQFINIGKDSVFEEGVTLYAHSSSHLWVGDECYVGKNALLHAEGNLSIATGCRVQRNAEVISAEDIQVGEHVWIARGCKIEGKMIRFEGRAILGPDVSVFTDNHFQDSNSGEFTMKSSGQSEPVVFKSGCWVGSKAVILKGVTVGRGALVGAGAVVAKDVDEGCVVGGVPAKLIKRIGMKNVSEAASH